MIDYETWRVGRHLGRTVYRQVGEEPSDDDVFIGVMDSRELAEFVVSCVNKAHAKWPIRAQIVTPWDERD